MKTPVIHPHWTGGDVQGGLHARTSHGEADAVEIGDDEQDAEEGEHTMTVFRGGPHFCGMEG